MGSLSDDFEGAIPPGCENTVSRVGFTNLAAHYPENAETAPDLGEVLADSCVRITNDLSPIGPKMYIACGAENEALHGTTRLHLDVADAVNLTTWTVEVPNDHT